MIAKRKNFGKKKKTLLDFGHYHSAVASQGSHHLSDQIHLTDGVIVRISNVKIHAYIQLTNNSRNKKETNNCKLQSCIRLLENKNW